MREDIIDILNRLGNGEAVFFEQDSLPQDMRDQCKQMLLTTNDLRDLNRFFDEKIAPIIFHSHNMYLSYMY